MSLHLAHKFWDCSCEENFIHLKTDALKCPVCDSREEDCPDSRVNEVVEMLENRIANIIDSVRAVSDACSPHPDEYRIQSRLARAVDALEKALSHIHSTDRLIEQGVSA
mgnify:CR=1 FL=1